METFVTSYKGMRIDGKTFEEKEGTLPDTEGALTDFVSTAVSGIILRKDTSGIGFKGIFPKQAQ